MPILGALCLALFAGAVVGFMAWTNVPHDKRRRPDFMIPFVVVFNRSIGLYGVHTWELWANSCPPTFSNSTSANTALRSPGDRQ